SQFNIIGGFQYRDNANGYIGSATQNSSSNNVTGPSYAVEFMTDAANFTTSQAGILVGLFQNGAAPNGFNVAVDDVYQSSAYIGFGAGENITIQFNTPGIHKVRLEFPSGMLMQSL